MRIIVPGRLDGSSAMDEPHSGQKWRRIGLPLSAECLDHSPDLESRLGQAHHDAERAAGEFLAVATVAHTDEFRCRIRCIANRATKAAAIQFGHLLLPPISAAIFARNDLAARRPAMTTLKISIASRRPGRPPKFPTFLVPRRMPAGSLMDISIRIRRLARVTDKGRTSLFRGSGREGP